MVGEMLNRGSRFSVLTLESGVFGFGARSESRDYHTGYMPCSPEVVVSDTLSTATFLVLVAGGPTSVLEWLWTDPPKYHIV